MLLMLLYFNNDNILLTCVYMIVYTKSMSILTIK
jgi:hypothetical protein